MKPFSQFFTDLGLFLVFFGVATGFLYTGVYSEETIYPISGAVLISEVCPSGGVGKTNDEFIELYNPGTQPVVIGGWGIFRQTKSATSTDRLLLFTFPSGAILPGHAHILVAHADFVGEVAPDFRYAGQTLADDNTVILVNGLGQVVDLVGYGLAKNVEISAAEAPSGQLLSIERRAGGLLGNGQDTNNNRADFFKVQSNPQNLSSLAAPALVIAITEAEVPTSTFAGSSQEEPVLEIEDPIIQNFGAEVFIPTTTLGNIVSSTVVIVETTSTTIITSTSSISATTISAVPEVVSSTPISLPASVPIYAVGSIVINELYPVPESGQNEFVELFNTSIQAIDLLGWYLTEGSSAKTNLSGVLNSKNYLIIEKPKGSLNNAGDLVSLFAPNNNLIDRMAYGDWNDGSVSNNAISAEAGLSLGRIQDGQDSDQDKLDFGLSTVVTKGTSNIYSPLLEEAVVIENAEEPVITVINNSVVTTTVKTMAVKPGPLYPRIVYSPKGNVGVSLIFDASQTSGGQGVKHFIWEMDDGVILHGEIITHAFAEAGNYSVGLTVIDDTGIEKHKTVKVFIEGVVTEDTGETKTDIATAKIKLAAVKKTNQIVFASLSEIGALKTNTQLRTRGVLAGVLITKTNPEFYLVAEANAGGPAAGILIKTKNTALDARLGDVVEITGKYITNNTGNYVQFSSADQLSIVESGVFVTPVSSTIKEVKQLTGGYVQLTGEVVDKKSGYIFMGDATGEIKVNSISSDSLKVHDLIIVAGYIIRTKDGVEIKLAGADNIQVKKILISSEEIIDEKPIKQTLNFFIIFGIIIVGLIGWCAKKFWFKNNSNTISETGV